MKDGWYVKQLLLTMDQIRSNIIVESYTTDGFEDGDDFLSWETSFILMFEDDDTYSDLLSLELKIKEMLNKNFFDKKERQMIEAILSGVPVPALPKELKMSKLTTLTVFNRLCEKIAYFMGGHFTNAGFITKFLSKYSYRFNKNSLRKLYNILGENTDD